MNKFLRDSTAPFCFENNFLAKPLVCRVSRLIRLIYQRGSIFPGLLSSNDADTISTELYSTYTQPRWWWRLSCRYLCCAARNPPSDDSQRHKSLVSHLSGTFPSPSSASLLLVLFFSLSLALPPLSSLLVFSRRSSLLSSISPLTPRSLRPPARSYRLSPLHFPYPGIRFYRSTVMMVSAKSTEASITSTQLSQPPPTITTTSRRCIAVGSSPWTEERVRVHRREIYGCFEGDIDRCNINKWENV